MLKSNTNQSIDLFGFSSSYYMKQFGLFMSDCIMLPKKLEVIYVIKIFTYKMGDLSAVSIIYYYYLIIIIIIKFTILI